MVILKQRENPKYKSCALRSEKAERGLNKISESEVMPGVFKPPAFF
jgi:hypothetical protein